MVIREQGGACVPDVEVPADHLARYEWAGPQLQDLRVLDAGSGYGYGSDYLAAHGARSVVGIDTDPQAIRYARGHYARTGLQFARGKIQAVRAGSFEAVVSFEVLEHVHDGPAYVSELARLLRPGGLLFLSTPNRSFTERSYVDGRSPNPYHLREYYAAEVTEMLRPHFASVSCFHEENPESFWTYSDNCWVPASLRQLVPKRVKAAWLHGRGVEPGGTPGRFHFSEVQDPARFPASWGAQVYRCRR
ncbi:MAG: methyltransferase domain-containing protein [Thermoplasmata archaeon]|nr:methyltransferase domain-containing protein [Thermoplasmata archaeon]